MVLWGSVTRMSRSMRTDDRDFAAPSPPRDPRKAATTSKTSSCVRGARHRGQRGGVLRERGRMI
eukprot:7723673-Pyramimonas_sp.AAC.1